jgi:hypothetical protein
VIAELHVPPHGSLESSETAMSAYTASVLPVHDLTDRDREAMAALYLSHYDCASKQQFHRDLDGKTSALLVTHEGDLVGFSTIQVYERAWLGRPIRVVYSGDTVVHRDHWGQQALALTWISHAGELKHQDPDRPLYWFLIVKGHRTYRYLPVFANSFHPHWAEDPADLKPLADWLATEKFGAEYNQRTGVVEFAVSQGQLKPDIAMPKEGELRHEAVRFFLERNPGFARGHELVCLCELCEENLKPIARRAFTRPVPCAIPG